MTRRIQIGGLLCGFAVLSLSVAIRAQEPNLVVSDPSIKWNDPKVLTLRVDDDTATVATWAIDGLTLEPAVRERTERPSVHPLNRIVLNGRVEDWRGFNLCLNTSTGERCMDVAAIFDVK